MKIAKPCCGSCKNVRIIWGYEEFGCDSDPLFEPQSLDYVCKNYKPRNPIEISASSLIIAFVQGAKWWEWEKEKATMWQTDQCLAEGEAVRKEKNKTLGIDPFEGK